MKKILVSLLFLVAAVASFAQIDSINYPARKMPFGNWDFIWTNGALTDTVKVYPEKGGIGLDTLFFGDSKQWTAWQPGTSDTGFVKTTGDSITGTLYFPGAEYSLIDAQSAKFSSSTNYYSLLNHDRLTIQNGTGQLTKLDTAGIWFVGHDFTVTDDAPFEYLRHNYGDSSTTIFGKLLLSNTDSTLIRIFDTFFETNTDFEFKRGAYTHFTLDDSLININSAVKLQKSLQVGNDTTAASAANVGAIRYRSDANNSYCEMVMQTGASSYAWVVIKQNTW